MEVIERRLTTDLAAYDLYLKGLYLSRLDTRDELEAAIRCFEMATRKDPSFASAYSAWGNVYISGAGVHFARKDSFPRAQELVNRALELDPHSSEAHMVRGNLALQGDLDWGRAEVEFRKAISLNPGDADAHFWYAMLLATVQRFEEAKDELRESIRANPMHSNAWYWLIELHYLSGDFYAATTLAEDVLDRDPSSFHACLLTGCCYWAEGRAADAMKEANQLAGPAKPWGRVSRAILYALLGRPEEAVRLVKELEAASKSRYVPLMWMADLYGILGEKEKTLDLLERDYHEGDRGLWMGYQLPQYDSLRAEPRFVALLREYHLPTEVRERPMVPAHVEEVHRPTPAVPA